MTDSGTPRRASASVGGAIRQARSGRYTLAQLAQRSGTSSGLLSLIERGQGNPSFETLSRIATALGVSLVRLLEAADERSVQGAVAGDTVRALVPLDGSFDLLSSNRPDGADRLFAEEPAWQTSMVLQRGQEARIRVLDGSLVLALRDAGSDPAGSSRRPLAVDVEVRTTTQPSVVTIPPVDDQRWMRIVDGSTPFQPTTLAARMLFTHVTRCVRQDPSSPNIDHWVGELRAYFVKYEAVSRDELARIFG